MSKLKNSFFYFFLVILFLAVSFKEAKAAVLSLDPDSLEVAVGDTFTVDLDLDTKNENTTATDVVLTFDPALLEVIDVSFGDTPLYPTNTKILDNTNGKLSLTSTQKDAVNSYKGEGTLAVLTLRAKSLGTANLVFSCESGKTNDSNVFKKGTSTDILECGNLEYGVYTISQTGSGTAPTRQPTPTKTLPQSGNLGPTSFLVLGGVFLLSLGVLLFVF